jgi:hypothetical protein
LHLARSSLHHGSVQSAEAAALIDQLGLRAEVEEAARALPPLTPAQRARLRAICARDADARAPAERVA